MNLSLAFPEPARDLSELARPDNRLETALAHFEELQQYENSPITAVRRLPARPARYAPMPERVSPALARVLHARGIEQLFTHQAAAFDAVAAGRHLVIVTPTASGKTLCYNLPVLQHLIQNPGGRALYLFPTKALAEDQLHEFNSIVDQMAGDIRAFTYDGDTPQDARRAIRERANVVLSNPDMLHSGILPHHTRWAKLFENLRFVVLDELHTYRGVFGSHVANLLRRLKRICAFYGSNPQFICCSATIANPGELARALLEEPVEGIDSSGAPVGEKYVVFYNPPVVNQQLGIRRSYIHETRNIASGFIERGQQTLVFANNRLATEVLVTYLKDACERGPLPEASVRGYRGGYLPKERREIERKLRDGEIRAVVATNALELGIDIGSLDVVVMAGYPGSIASTWQRAGRAGRRHSLSAAVLVASSAPLDQYIIEHPDYFFDRSPEHAYINPDNLEILVSHLKCAAFELPIRDGETFGRHPTADLCKFLEDVGVVHHAGNAWHWTSESYPADAVSLRAATSDNFVIIDITGEPTVIGEVDFPSALTTLHEKAIYLHEGRQYHVERFDYEERKAYVKSVACDYFTDAIDYTQVKVLDTFDTEPVGHGARSHGEVRLNRQIVGFKKIKFYTLENVGAGQLSMPEQEMHTTSFWLSFPQALLERLAGFTPSEKQSGLAGLGNVLRTVAAVLLMCDPRDLGVSVTEDATGGAPLFEPNLYLYDNYPGGIGQSEPLFRLCGRMLEQARDLLERCPCKAGCPSCVGPIGEVGERGKEAALRFLAELLAS
ncbi:MAG: DEAD/DEAH box helicase [Acidobacteria bacterium]|nr:DEAD/DEAH box helicase [Acidobacteriota bacterium]